jgi:hypothetical protein
VRGWQEVNYICVVGIGAIVLILGDFLQRIELPFDVTDFL